MAFVMNGVIIPEDTANAFSFNGSDVTDVFMNGVQVFNQSLFSATWSGDTLINISGTNYGIDTSGSLYRVIGGVNGAWLTADANGLDSGVSYDSSAYSSGIITAPTTLQMTTNAGVPTGTIMSFSKVSGFSGTAGDLFTIEFQSSGGAIRIYRGSDASAGNFITLT